MRGNAVVVGSTNGIGKAIACRLARDGFNIVAVGRDKPGRREELLSHLAACSQSDGARHEFRPCDAFSLAQVKACAEGVASDYAREGIDALVLTQGMATIQGFTPTSEEGNDEKLTLHLWSRIAMANCLLPALRESKCMRGGPVVLSVLSGGVHGPYAKYKTDPELKNNYSIKTAADFAGFYNDLVLDRMAEKNPSINFVHASPGFVASNWGTEMPTYLRYPIRFMQRFAMSTDKCAGNMVKPILQCADGDIGLSTPEGSHGLFIMREKANSGTLTKGHSDDAIASAWKATQDVLSRSGVELE